MKYLSGKLIASSVLAVAMGIGSAHAGCKIQIDVKNSTGKSISVDWRDSKVKVKNGTWKKLGSNSQTIGNNKTKSHSYNATFGCNKNRQYKIYWAGGGSDGWEYYPSTSGFSKNQTVKVTAR